MKFDVSKKSELKRDILEVINNMSVEEKVMLFNKYCTENNMEDDWIFNIDIFDVILDDYSPTQIAEKIHYGKYDPELKYFKFDIEDNIESLNDDDVNGYVCGTFGDLIVDYIMKTGCNLLADEVEKILEKYDENRNGN